MAQDFNNIRQWLLPKLQEANLSIEKFARLSDLTRATVYFYIDDKNRPSEQAMIRMCQVLGVPAAEGLSQYTPKPVGRPPMGAPKLKKRLYGSQS